MKKKDSSCLSFNLATQQKKHARARQLVRRMLPITLHTNPNLFKKPNDVPCNNTKWITKDMSLYKLKWGKAEKKCNMTLATHM